MFGVAAMMRVRQDFFHYRSGVYAYSGIGEHDVGYHSVRLLGWGEEGNVKYWVSAGVQLMGFLKPPLHHNTVLLRGTLN